VAVVLHAKELTKPGLQGHVLRGWIHPEKGPPNKSKKSITREKPRTHIKGWVHLGHYGLFRQGQSLLAVQKSGCGKSHQVGTEKRACVYEYRLNSRVVGNLAAIVPYHLAERSAFRFCAAIALFQDDGSMPMRSLTAFWIRCLQP
jgi:hypothetical protein